MKLNDEGISPPKPAKILSTASKLPLELAAALKSNRKALDSFSPSQRQEYSSWIAEAKSDATRDHRLEQAMEWVADGKSRNWKYQK